MSDSEERTVVEPVYLCDICGDGDPELCCFMCNNGAPYHEECWGKYRHHAPGRKPIHEKAPIAWLGRLQYFNEPNMQASIEDEKFQQDDENCFIEFDIQSEQEKYHLGQRAFPLLRATDGLDSEAQCPSFISFVGRTGNGKSFLIRALQHEDTADGQPTPIPAPGYESHNHRSTSGNIHLYADAMTARIDSPILFLDCEGFEGSDVPRGVRMRMDSKTAEERRRRVEITYPRFIYAFSTCIVFVTSGPLQESADIQRRLISYASEGASGTKNQGFKPSLFLVFNRFRGGKKPDFDWSMESSSNAFLADGNVAELKNFYSSIHVVYIPDVNPDFRPGIALKQIDAFKTGLREEHEEAFRRRQAFNLVFKPKDLIPIMQKALELFSRSRKSVFDWSVESALVESNNIRLTMPLYDLWTQYVRYHATPPIPHGVIFTDFGRHIAFCHCLQLSRNPGYGLHIAEIPLNWAPQLERLSDHIQCGALHSAGLMCEKVRLRHGEYHEYIKDESYIRWAGRYKASQTFQEFFKVVVARLGDSEVKATLGHLTPETIPREIRSVIVCIGCLQRPPSTILACGHAFCLDCIRELTELTNDHILRHRCKTIQCPIHRELGPQRFSPRLLPVQSGCRILSLDGGGVKGLAQLIVLKAIERRCFGIPVLHLFDLVVGTSSGGQIALALTTPSPSEPLTVTTAIQKFRELMKASFPSKEANPIMAMVPAVKHLFGGNKYKVAPVERQLKDLFSQDTKLFSAATSSRLGVPNIAVTTVAEQPFQAYLISNYNRKPSDDAVPLLFGTPPNDCMRVWVAARCTSATPGYFKPLEWQRKMLLDGGLQYNCPAACSYSEAKSIWPGKPCDILLSLGTGTAEESRSSMSARLRRPKSSHRIISADIAWSTFVCSLGENGDRMFRLNPENIGFEPDDSQALDEIESQATDWVESQNKELTNICDQLVAALFFFRPLGSNGGVWQGEILCRLSADLEANQNLVHRMLQVQEDGLNLFQVDYGDGARAPTNVVQALKDSCSIEELRIHVILPDLPRGARIHVKMRSLVTDQLVWLPISGSPYEVWSAFVVAN